MEELVRIYREANQLRMSTITSIVGVLNMDQTALFLESVCKILAGFKHQDQAFQNSLFGHNHLIPHQLINDDDHELLHPMMQQQHGAHLNYPDPIMLQQHDAPWRPPPNHHHVFHPNHPPHMMPPPPGVFYQVFPHPSAPSGEVFAHPRMMQPFAPQRPPLPMNQHHHHQGHVIYVGNLAPEATNELLRQGFSRYRSVRESKIRCDEGGNAYGFVSFADERDKIRAMREMNRQIFLGRPMNIRPAFKNSI